MKDAIAHPDLYFRGEQWVLGDRAAANIDLAGGWQPAAHGWRTADFQRGCLSRTACVAEAAH